METPIIVKNSGYIVIEKIVDSHDGVLCIANSQQDIPFDIKRVYYINKFKHGYSIRGKHAHKSLQQVIFCINGSFILSLDDGTTQQEIQMLRDNKGVILGPMLWHSMHSFSNECILLILASDYFDESDYIRDYATFIKLVKGT